MTQVALDEDSLQCTLRQIPYDRWSRCFASATNILRLPNLPDLADQRRPRRERDIPGLPAGGRNLASLAYMLEGLELAKQLVWIATHFGRQNFHRPDDKIRVDDEAAADIDSGGFVVDAVNFPDIASAVGEHRKWDPSLQHLGEFFFLPDLVDKAAIRAQR
jgi:hypothetical protein